MTIDDASPYVDRVRACCWRLPEAYEERAWVGVRWRVRGQTFAHVLTIEDGWPPAYARAAGTDGPTHVLMLRASGPELDALHHAGPPFFPTPWRHDEIGVRLGSDTDWDEVAELVAESYCARAPRRLVERLRNGEVGDGDGPEGSGP